MQLEIDLDNTVPIYTQIRNQMLQAIADGALAPGAELPSLRALASALGVNLHTVNKAYAQLADEGFIVMRPGQAAVVAGALPKDSAQFREALAPQLSALVAEAKVRQMPQASLEALVARLYKGTGQ